MNTGTVFQALRKSGHSTERGEDYLLVEDVHKSWDKKDAEKGGTQRVLELNERVMQAQNKWRGSGRFLLRKKTGVSSSQSALCV